MIIQTTLGKFCPFKYGKELSANKRLPGDFPVYGSNGIVGFHNESYVKTHGVVIGRKGSVGALHISDGPFWPIDTSFYAVKGDYFETLYTYYLLKSLGLNDMNSDSAVPGLNRDNAHALKIDVLEKEEDRAAVGKLISKFDDKIENNQRMNETLEEMAQAIFKSWFVDFDPVHAKAAGNPPAHMDTDTAALFPNSFSDDGLPVGWKQKNVLEAFDFTMGQSPPSSTYNEEKNGIPFWQGRRDFGFRFPSNRVYCTAPTRFANEGDTLISVRAPVGDVNRALERCCIGRGVAALMHKSKLASYTYYTALELREQFKVYEAIGTVFGSINKTEFGKLKIVASDGGIEDVFESLVSALDSKILTNHLEIETLKNLRDTLLPKLMSGEVHVKDAERKVEDL